MADIVLKDVTSLQDCVRILNGFVGFADDIGKYHPLYREPRYGQQKLEPDGIDQVMRVILSLPPNVLDNFISVLNTARELIEEEKKARQEEGAAREARTLAKWADDDFEDRLSRFSQFENNPKKAPKKME